MKGSPLYRQGSRFDKARRALILTAGQTVFHDSRYPSHVMLPR